MQERLMKVIAIVGSLRKDLFNMQLVKMIEMRYNHLFEVEIADIRSLPDEALLKFIDLVVDKFIPFVKEQDMK